MDKRKLHVWEPVGKINGELHLMGMEYPVGGLQLKFEDDSGIGYKFIYDRVVDGWCVWSCRFSEEWTRGDLSLIASEARKEKFGEDNQNCFFYKMTNSEFVEWYDQLIGPGSEMYPHIEHHIYFTSDDTFEVLSEYEPRVIVTELSEQGKEESDNDENR